MSARLLVRAAAPAVRQTRAFATSAPSRDIVQDLYLSNLKSFQPKPKASDAHVGIVREFSAPKAPAAPEAPSSSVLAGELDAYAAAEPDHAEAPKTEGQTDAAGLSISEYLKEAAKPIEIHAEAH